MRFGENEIDQRLDVQLRWQLALVCDDPDAPSKEPWVHWVIYGGTLQGKNSWPSGQVIGYRGPLPPPGDGIHHYHFKIYALDTELDLEPEISKSELLAAMQERILAMGKLIGTYQR